MVMDNRLIGVSEAAKILHVSRNTIGNYVQSGMLEAYYVPESTSRRFWLEDVMAIPKKTPYGGKEAEA